MSLGTRRTAHRLSIDAPFLALGGAWEIHQADGQSVVTLGHEYELDDDTEELAGRVTRFIDEFSRRELEALRLSSERLARLLQQHSAVRGA